MGVALMYLLDPSQGRSRRTAVGDTTRRLYNKARSASPALLPQRWSPSTRYLAGAGALAAVTLATVATRRHSHRKAARATNANQAWNPAGLA